MLNRNLPNLLKTISIGDFGKLTRGNENIQTLLQTLNYACWIRGTVINVQLENSWQETIEGRAGIYLFYDLKLSSSFLERAYQKNMELNLVNWQFVLPNINEVKLTPEPITSSDYLSYGEIFIDTDDDYVFTCLNQLV